MDNNNILTVIDAEGGLPVSTHNIDNLRLFLMEHVIEYFVSPHFN